MGDTTPLESLSAQLRRAADALGLDEDQLAVLQSPDRILETDLPIRVEDGSIETFRAYRSEFNCFSTWWELWPFFGILLYPGVSRVLRSECSGLC